MKIDFIPIASYGGIKQDFKQFWFTKSVERAVVLDHLF